MFLNFRIANFRSINHMVELSMIPNDLRNSTNIISESNPNATKNKDYFGLTSAAIYGANASGKSNIIKALEDFREFVVDSTDKKPNESIELFNPFKLNKENLEKPSSFSIDLVIEKVLYSYSIDVFKNQILNENLYFYPKGIKTKVFVRNNQDFSKGNGYEGAFEIIKDRTTENQLFLSKAAMENIEIAKRLYNSINSILILTTDIFHSLDFNEKFIGRLMDGLKSDDKLFKLSKSLIAKLDTQVVDFEEKEGQIKTIHLNCENEKVEFEFSEESSGTQRVISFIPVIFVALKAGSTIIVDEFERSLHPEIAQYILGMYNDSEINKKGAQFIFATHDTTLLNSENNLRRDQIYLVEKNEKGETELYSASDIKGLREGNYEKWYLEGRLGGIPNIAKKTFRQELIDFVNS